MPLNPTSPFNTRFVFFPADLGQVGFRKLAVYNSRWRDVTEIAGIYTSHSPLAGTVIGTKRDSNFRALAILLDCMNNILWICPEMFRYFHTGTGRRWSQVEHGTNIRNSTKEFRVVATASPILVPPEPSSKRGHAEAWYNDLLRQGSIVRREDMASILAPTPQTVPEPPEEDPELDEDYDRDVDTTAQISTTARHRLFSTPVSQDTVYHNYFTFNPYNNASNS